MGQEVGRLLFIRHLDLESRLADGGKQGISKKARGGGPRALFFPFPIISFYTHARLRSAYSPPRPTYPFPTSLPLSPALTMSSTSEEEAFYPPSKLGEYTVVQEVGEGTFGKVKSKQSVDPATPRLSSSNPQRLSTPSPAMKSP